ATLDGTVRRESLLVSLIWSRLEETLEMATVQVADAPEVSVAGEQVSADTNAEVDKPMLAVAEVPL
ncbi:MAG: hypothetical protein WAJ87_06800, partial [Bryobacteraceae bacterium]